MNNRRLMLMPAALLAAGAGARVAVHRQAEVVKGRVDPRLDPLYDVPGDVKHHDLAAADGGRIHVMERGSGRPLLLIHGITLQARIWAPQLHLMTDRYRVLAMDVRGHGQSSAGGDGYGRRIAARDVKSVLDHLDLRDAIVVGHSMGGMILMEFAGDFPEELVERVAGLVFMDTAAYQLAPKPVLPLAKAMGRRLRTRHEAGRRIPDRPMGDDDLSWVMCRLAFGSRPSARAVDEVRRCGAEVPQTTTLPSGIDLLDHDARRALAATNTPSMVLVGSRDLLTPVYAARRIAQFLPHARFEVLKGAGHQLMQERPYEVAALLDDFAATLPAPASGDPTTT
ncbi:MAG TPA: alpha/beta hydrolase [Acidimicrobiales bacterium]|jgi:pimeloyl-ACP methyl ester carboxylesterase|nr:alpha/beta hydrolase [Acidimicrobiales bacterium]